jgi:hypothetical protein
VLREVTEARQKAPLQAIQDPGPQQEEVHPLVVHPNQLPQNHLHLKNHQKEDRLRSLLAGLLVLSFSFFGNN